MPKLSSSPCTQGTPIDVYIFIGPIMTIAAPVGVWTPQSNKQVICRHIVKYGKVEPYFSLAIGARWYTSIGMSNYHQTSNINRTLLGNKIVDHPDVVGASPIGAAPTTSSFST